MLLKTDWEKYLHKIRETEIKRVFDYLGNKPFLKGLEVGCGDGYQTIFISKHCDKFVSGDLNFSRIKENLKVPDVSYKQFDADKLDGVFNTEEFDFVFSSNVLEHLNDPRGFLENTNLFLKNDGYAVHIIPARPLKVSYLLLHYINLAFLVADRLVGILKGNKIFRGQNINTENNINTLKNEGKEKSKFSKIFFPQIHGNFKSHSEEFVKFGKKSWEKLFEETGYQVVKYIKGPAFSGYGFGLDWFRKTFEFFGWSSEHIFVLKKDI